MPRWQARRGVAGADLGRRGQQRLGTATRAAAADASSVAQSTARSPDGDPSAPTTMGAGQDLQLMVLPPRNSQPRGRAGWGRPSVPTTLSTRWGRWSRSRWSRSRRSRAELVSVEGPYALDAPSGAGQRDWRDTSSRRKRCLSTTSALRSEPGEPRWCTSPMSWSSSRGAVVKFIVVATGAAGTFLDWGFIHVSVANVIVIAVMVLLFVLAIVLPFPHGDRPGGGGGSP